ncbi:hypothetical protein GCM10022237_42090 [Nocardioides ginsengisoli]|uniref:MmpS family membrane protein n=1 Tax=Nocardioides ginsengisoli TaxID=363868 RepID=A0ABW3W5A9_9ACTN
MTQQPSTSTGRTIGLIVGIVLLVIVLFCSGIVALFVWFLTNVKHAVSDFDPHREGGRDNPITVAVGQAFDIDGIDYAAGWTYGDGTIAGLKGSNRRDDGRSRSVFLTFTFVTADRVEVGEVTCSSSGSIAHGNSEELDCQGSGKVSATYDHVDVSASY